MQNISSGIKALTGVMLIIIGAMIPSAILLPQKDLSISIVQLQSTWQFPALILCSLVCGPRIAIVSAISYLIIGLFYLPIFHGGGSVGYILTPEFGYLIGFIPASWICGSLSTAKTKSTLIEISKSTIISLLILHFIGIIYLTLGNLMGSWNKSLIDLIFINSVLPFPSQLLLCLSVSLLSLIIKRILLIK